jgi:hypothetical protein
MGRKVAVIAARIAAVLIAALVFLVVLWPFTEGKRQHAAVVEFEDPASRLRPYTEGVRIWVQVKVNYHVTNPLLVPWSAASRRTALTRATEDGFGAAQFVTSRTRKNFEKVFQEAVVTRMNEVLRRRGLHIDDFGDVDMRSEYVRAP